MNYQADNNGFYGQYGGAYVPEILFKAVENLRMPLTWNANVPNVERMRMLGATVVPVRSGNMTLKDATNASALSTNTPTASSTWCRRLLQRGLSRNNN